MKKLYLIIMLIFTSAALFPQSAADYYNRAEESRKNYEYEKAIEYYEKAGKLWMEEGRRDYYAVMQSKIGYLYFGLGNYDLALECFKYVLSINEELGRKASVSRDLNNIGSVYLSWGKYDLAIKYFKDALDIGEELGDKALVAVYVNNIGGVYKSQGKYGLALEYYERALAIDEGLGNKENIATDLNNIGGVYDSWGKYELALEYFKRALAIEERLGDRAGVAVRLNNIGKLYYAWGKYEPAMEYFTRSLTIEEELGVKAGVATTLNNIGVVYYDQKMYEQAIDYFRRSIEITEQLRLTASGNARRDYLASQIGTYQFLISSTIRARRYTEAFNAVEQSKARYLAEKIGEEFNVRNLSFKTAREIQMDLSPDEAVLIYANTGLEKSAVLLIVREGMQALEIDKKPFIDSIEAEHGRDIAFTLETTRGLKVWGQEKDAVENEGSFEDIVSYYRYLLTIGQPGRTDKEQREKIGRELYNLLIAPIEQPLDGKAALSIVPGGVLGFLPFETLIDGRGRYLVENYSIRYTQSLAVSDLIAGRKYNTRKKPLLAFGGAVYEADGGSAGGSGRKSGDEYPAAVSDREITYAITRGAEYIGNVYDRMGLRWSNLPGTLEEVQEIKQMFPGAAVFTGKDVHEKKIKELSACGGLKGYKILHFSTHGMVVPEYPELSALVLSQVDGGSRDGSSGGRSPGGGQEQDDAAAEDGYLCMAEIAALDIEAEFVNLSACETGLGKIYAGEGVVGLTQSFLIAGANGLSVSLWQVADESTKEFMAGMYRKVKDEGLTYAEAIRQMKLEFLGGASSGGTERVGAAYGGRYANPFYWAPFVYYGE